MNYDDPNISDLVDELQSIFGQLVTVLGGNTEDEEWCQYAEAILDDRQQYEDDEILGPIVRQHFEVERAMQQHEAEQENIEWDRKAGKARRKTEKAAQLDLFA